jgi:hypothetical protein
MNVVLGFGSLEIALAECNALAKFVDNYVVYLRALFHYRNISGLICTLQRFQVK